MWARRRRRRDRREQKQRSRKREVGDARDGVCDPALRSRLMIVTCCIGYICTPLISYRYVVCVIVRVCGSWRGSAVRLLEGHGTIPWWLGECRGMRTPGPTGGRGSRQNISPSTVASEARTSTLQSPHGPSKGCEARPRRRRQRPRLQDTHIPIPLRLLRVLNHLPDAAWRRPSTCGRRRTQLQWRPLRAGGGSA